MADVVFKKMPASARRVEGDVVPVEEIARACESKMAEFYELKTASGSEIKRGSVKHIKIVVESLQGGRKHMTHVQNIDAWGIDPEVARTELQVMRRGCCLCLTNYATFTCLFVTWLRSACVPVHALCSRCPATTAKSCRYKAPSTRRCAFPPKAEPHSCSFKRLHRAGRGVSDQDVWH